MAWELLFLQWRIGTIIKNVLVLGSYSRFYVVVESKRVSLLACDRAAYAPFLLQPLFRYTPHATLFGGRYGFCGIVGFFPLSILS